MGFIPVPWRQGCFSPSGPLPCLPDPDAWEWPYEWKRFLGSPFVDESGEGLISFVLSIQSEEIVVNDGKRIVAQYTQSGELSCL